MRTTPGAEGGGAGAWAAPALVHPSTVAPRVLGRQCFLRGIPGHGAPQSHPLCPIPKANSSPLQESAFPAPGLSAQPRTAPHSPARQAPMHPHLRQGSPGLIPREALRFAATRTPGPTSAEEVQAGRSDKSPQSGAHPRA